VEKVGNYLKKDLAKPGYKAQSVGGGWSGVVTGYPLVLIHYVRPFVCDGFVFYLSRRGQPVLDQQYVSAAGGGGPGRHARLTGQK